jgi:hypothetical protein
MDDEADRRSPSQQAINAAIAQTQNFSTNMGSPSSSNPINGNTGTSASQLSASNTTIRTTLFSYIIDCWVTFTSVPDTIASSSTANPV